jgi:hypothetical protein
MSLLQMEGRDNGSRGYNWEDAILKMQCQQIMIYRFQIY